MNTDDGEATGTREKPTITERLATIIGRLDAIEHVLLALTHAPPSLSSRASAR